MTLNGYLKDAVSRRALECITPDTHFPRVRNDVQGPWEFLNRELLHGSAAIAVRQVTRFGEAGCREWKGFQISDELFSPSALVE